MELQVLLGPQEPLAVKAAQVQQVLDHKAQREQQVLVLLGLLELELKVRLELLEVLGLQGHKELLGLSRHQTLEMFGHLQEMDQQLLGH
jgi:hypothetical protein